VPDFPIIGVPPPFADAYGTSESGARCSNGLCALARLACGHDRDSEVMMKIKRLLFATAASAFVFGSSAIVYAQTSWTGGPQPRASNQQSGSVADQPGASGRADPGDRTASQERDDRLKGRSDMDDRASSGPDRDERTPSRDPDDRMKGKSDRN
jgi:hypothetical protein